MGDWLRGVVIGGRGLCLAVVGGHLRHLSRYTLVALLRGLHVRRLPILIGAAIYGRITMVRSTGRVRSCAVLGRGRVVLCGCAQLIGHGRSSR